MVFFVNYLETNYNIDTRNRTKTKQTKLHGILTIAGETMASELSGGWIEKALKCHNGEELKQGNKSESAKPSCRNVYFVQSTVHSR